MLANLPKTPRSFSLLPIVSITESVAPGIWRWSAFSPHHRVDLASHLIWDGRSCLVFDPLPLAASIGSAWPVDSQPGWLVVTNENHERDLPAWTERFPSAVCIGYPVGSEDRSDKALPPGWVRFHLAGGAGGEMAFFCAVLDLMVFGDAVVNLPGRGLELLPDKYCQNPAQLRVSLKSLPRFGRAIMSHGEPLMDRASEHIQALLQSSP
jgi:hypothetical protein